MEVRIRAYNSVTKNTVETFSSVYFKQGTGSVVIDQVFRKRCKHVCNIWG
jgi:hypothetical protein